MTSTPPATTDTPPLGTASVGSPPPAGPVPPDRRRRRRRWVAGGAAVALVAAAGIALGSHRPVLGPAELEQRRERQRLPDLVRHCPAGNAPRTDRAIGHAYLRQHQQHVPRPPT